MAKRKKDKALLRRIPVGELTWIDISEPSVEALEELKTQFPFLLDIDLKDCLPPFQRPKLLTRENYLFMVLLFPLYDAAKRVVRPMEVDFFIGKDFLITNHSAGGHPALAALARDCAEGGEKNVCAALPADSPGRLLYTVVHAVSISCFPLLTDLNNDLLGVEERLFEEPQEEVIREILRIRTNIVNFRKAMQGHEHVFHKLRERGKRFFGEGAFDPHYEDLVGHAKEIWEFLENDKDTIEALYGSHLSLVSHRTTEASKNLTALALIVFPMTLVAAIFSMRAENMPFLGSPNDFWIMLSVVFGTMLCTVLFLKKRKWL